jgi:hypothetical protein
MTSGTTDFGKTSHPNPMMMIVIIAMDDNTNDSHAFIVAGR